MYYPQIENKLVRQLLSQLAGINSDKIIYILLFLFPIFAVTVRHWVSGIFGVLSLISLIMLFRNRKQRIELLDEEKLLIWGFVIFFGVFVLTSLVNSWGQLQTRYAGVELRFLLFVPLYLLVRQMEYATRWLMAGCILGVIYAGYDAFNEIYLNNRHIYTGAYSQLLTGPIILLFTGLLVPYYYIRVSNSWQKGLLLLLICMAFFVISHTGARNAYMAAVVITVMFILHQYKGVKKYIFLVAAFSTIFITYNTNQTINHRVNQAYSEFLDYYSYPAPAMNKGRLSSIGTRLEMWRSTPIFFADNPLFGVGRGNYTAEVKKYVSQGLLHKEISKHGHPHNAYSEAIISKGLIGIVSLLWIIVYPLVRLAKGYRTDMRTSFYGIILISAYLVFSLTDASPFIKRNYASIYIIFLAVLFSYYIQEKKKLKTKLE